MTKHIFKFKICLFWACFATLFTSAQEVPFTPRLIDGNTFINIKGDYTFLSNSVMNRVFSDGTGANVPYNGDFNNNSFHIEYVDIDSDNSTFNSSSSTLTLPDCSQIYWAGLYWAGNYDVERDGDHRSRYVHVYNDDSSRGDFTQVKLRVPGSTNYIDLQADNNPDPVGEEDNVIIDGLNTVRNDPYVCYKNVTNILQALPDASGEYFVGNVRGTRGATTYGAAGWTLVVIYENPTMSGRYISVFDGYEGITTASGDDTADITVNGFNTIPVGPVNARVGVSVLEGETRLDDDVFGFVSNSDGSFTAISNAANPVDNFFNSTISIDGANVTNRNINSTNSMGYDSDVFNLTNPGNSIIDNGDTSATMRLATNGDFFASFLVTFSVEIIEPEILLEKRVEDIGGNDITGLGVNLGQTLDYVLSFRNTGNDDATSFTIRDVLPINTTLDELNLTLPPGVTHNFDAASGEITFTIPDNLVEVGDPFSSIRMRVQVAENCFDFIDACTTTIENLAFSTYQGVINSNVISDDPSVSNFDDCGFTTPGATNFLLDDLENCDFSRTVQLCGDNVLLDAGDNFDDYIWYQDQNGNGEIDPTDPVITDGDSDNDLSTLQVNQPGVYIVDKIVADPCLGFQEIITVETVGVTQTNPIATLINDTSNTVEGEIVICPNDGSGLPQIFLCGLNDTELIQVNIPDADSIQWELLDETSCSAGIADCANTNNSCIWNVVETGGDFLASDAGQYRLVINYQNGCFTRFYFNIFKNPLDPQANTRDIICNTDGNITVTNMPLDYEFRLIDQATGNVVVPYNPSPSFDIATNGAYTVEMRQQGVTDGCIFVLDNIGILNRDFQVDVTTRDTDCNGLGEIAISVLNVEPQYYYEISQGGTTVDTFGPSIDNNYTFENLNDGVYDILVTTDDGCNYTEQVTINDVTDLDLTAVTTKNIDCTDGIVTVTGSGGFPNPDYAYAIWSRDGVDLYTSISDIPGSAFQTANDFTFPLGEEGDYEFVVVDGNNCSFISNTVSVVIAPAIVYTTSQTEVSCFGGNDGSIIYNVTNTNGYTLDFTLTPTTGAPITNTSGSFTNLTAGDYTVTITQTQGGVSCDQIDNFTITEPAAGISADAVLTQDYTCLQNGSIEVQNVAGGTAPYEYSIDGINFVNTTTFPNLTNGSYTITVRDDNNCTFTTNTITIDPLNPPTDLTFTSTAPNCPALTSDVTVTAVNGNTPFVFEIVAPSAIAATSISGSTADFDGLAPDTYTFRVTDDKGCTYEESFTIAPVSQINVTGQLVSNISCFTSTDGELFFTVSDFNTDYDYSVTGPANFSGNNETNATISLNNLDDGTYNITVTDNLTNCTATTNVTINAPPAALTLSASETQPTCTTSGSVTLSSTGGWGGNSFTLTNPDASTFGTNSTGVFNNLTQTGLYTASVTDANGCVVNTTFTLNLAVPPVLAIVPNDTCFDAAVGLTLTANVTSGGDGNYEYSLNGGAFGTSNIFSGLTSGTYTIEVRDGNNCTDTESITINPELTVVASAPNITACATSTNVDITAAGGDGNYVYAIVDNGVTPTAGDFATTNPVNITGAGDYDVYVRDNAGASGFCEASFDLTIVQDAPLSISISDTGIQCSGEAQANITIVASGGEAPFEYSIDNGATYQTSNVFVNQPAGSYDIRVRDANNCDISQAYNISEPFTLSASAAVTQLAECNPGLGAEVRITNAIGGTAPYEYSFDGGTNYGSSPIGFLLPGTYTVFIRDANNCTFPMSVTVEPEPTQPGITTTIDYECDGEGTVTITPDSADFDYTYEIGGVPNTPATSNVFADIPVGTHTITVNYTSNIPPAPSVLLLEDFGVGPNTDIPQVDTAFYCYESQDASLGTCPDANLEINDLQYSVTSNIVSPFGAWISPNDASLTPNGRYLAVNVGNPGVNTVVYFKEDVEVIPNRNVEFSLAVFNLVRQGRNLIEPNILVELVDPLGTVISSGTTGPIPENNGPNDWQNLTIPALNPGANTTIDIVIRTIATGTSGNDVAIDNIQAFQLPEVCAGSFDTDIVIENGRAFDAQITASTGISCNGGNDGTITFQAENFVPATGFRYRYQLGAGAFTAFTTSFTSPVTLQGPTDLLVAGTYTIEVQDLRDASCSETLTVTLAEPAAVATSASVTDVLTCTNGGATLAASATGGTPGYEFQLETDLGAIVTAYQSSNTFTGVAAGDYVIRARDTNGCVDTTGTPITVADTQLLTFGLTATTCYLGDSNGSITATVATGNGGYQFRIDGGTWVVPGTNTHTFTGLTAGTYNIEVRDQLDCGPINQSITINPELTLTASAPNITSCGTDTDITISAAGGDGSYQYAVVNDGSPASGFGASNVITVTGAGDYDVYVRDGNGCEAVFDINIIQDDPIVITPTVVNNTCFGDSLGSIQVAVTGGSAPFQYSIDGGALQSSDIFTNLAAGTYAIGVEDSNGCTQTLNVSVTEPTQLVAEASLTTPYECGQDAVITVGSVTPTSGGSGTYEYSINGGPWAASTTFSGLNDGTYTVSVRDANAIGCTLTLPNIVIAPLPAEPTLATTIEYNCDGTANITVTPNDASYTYAIDGGSQQASNVFNNVAIGAHTITVGYGSNCFTTTPVSVAPGNALTTAIIASTDISCNGGNDGSITFEVENFDPVNGFEYRLGNTGPFTVSTTSPIVISNATTGDNVIAGTYDIEVRDVLDNSCFFTLSQTINQPDALVTDAAVTTALTCTNGGATITASILSGGTPGFEYRLEDASTLPAITVVRPYQNSDVFTGVPAGDYIVRARDANGCEDPIDASINVAPTTPITYTFTACYGGNNDGTIQIDVTAGNGTYEFSLNGGPWTAPSPTSATTFTFNNLISGNYTINVRDGLGCEGTLENVTIYDAPTIDVVDISTCANGSITVTAPVALTNLEYAFVPTGNSPAGSFSTTNTFTVTAGNDGDYDVYVRDTSASNAYCDFMETVTVNPAMPLTVVNTPTDPQCHDGVGSIEVDITSGLAPFTIQIIDLDNGGASNQTDTNVLVTTRTYFNLMPGDYTINVTDATGCTVSDTPITINNPDELLADILPILPPGCDPDINLTGFEFDNYPLTLSGTLQFSADGGLNWQTSDTFTGMDPVTGTIYSSGTVVNPSIRTVDASNNTLCQVDLPQYIIPFPLDDLNITISAIIVDCNDLQVTVQGTQGTPNYEYTFSEDPANFDEATATWTAPTAGNHVFTGLVPGRTYVFYVRDASPCVRQSTVNVNDVAPPPVEITSSVTPSCDGENNGQITYTVTETTPGELGGTFTWNLYELSNPTVSINSGTEAGFTSGDSFTVPVAPLTGLAPGTYFVEIQGAAPNNCMVGSENAILIELDPLTGTPVVLQNISCDSPGLIQIQNPNGGGGIYTYTLYHDINNTPGDLLDDVLITSSTSDNPLEVPANSPAGNYRVAISDQYSCEAELGQVPLTLTPNPTIDSVAVDNCSDPATVTITASSTAPQILYSIDGGTTFVDNGGVFNNVAAGTHNIAIRDSNGCSDTGTVTVHPVLQADVQLTKLLDCSGTPDAQITIEVIAGSTGSGIAGYDYEITDGTGTVVSRTNLPSNPLVFNTSVAEDYTITVYDNNTSTPTCSRVFNITVPPIVTPSFSVVASTDIACFNDADGSITVNAVDTGNGPYDFEIISGPGVSGGVTFPISPTSNNNTSATFTGLEGAVGAGITYTIEVTAQATGCTTTQTHTITQPSQLSVSASATPFGCTVGNNANLSTITITATDGTAPYLYSIDNVNFQTSNTFNIADTGAVQNITVFVTDANNCAQTDAVVIQPLDILSSTSVNIDDAATCDNSKLEDITITATGLFTDSNSDPANYEFRLLPNAFQPSGTFLDLGVGIHFFEARNTVTGCVIPLSHEVIEPENLELDLIATTNVTCYNDTDGTATLLLHDAAMAAYANGVSYTLVYDNNTPANLADDVTTNGTSADGNISLTTLAAGAYNITVVDDLVNGGNGCSYTQSFNIVQPDELDVAATATNDASCVDSGTITAAATFGTAPYTFQLELQSATAPTVATWTGTNTSGFFDGLANNTYTVYVRDANDCIDDFDITVGLDPLPQITASIVDECVAENSFELLVELTNPGGGSPYQISVNGGAFQNFSFDASNQYTVTGLSSGGPQSVTVRSIDGCSVTENFTIQPPLEFSASVSKLLDCTSSPNAEITINVAQGSGSYSFSVTGPVNLPRTTFPGSSVTWDDATLPGAANDISLPGTYTITIYDENTGLPCTENQTVTVPARLDPTFNITSFENVTCNTDDDGTISVAAVDIGTGPYTFQIVEQDGAPVAINPTSFDNVTAQFTGLDGVSTTGTTYTIRMTATGNDCTVDMDQLITEPDAIAVTLNPVTTFTCSSGNTTGTTTISVNSVTGGSTTYTVFEFINNQGTASLLDDVVVQSGTQTSFVATDINVLNYTINVYDDNGCLGSTTATIPAFDTLLSASVVIDDAATCSNGELEDITITANGLLTDSNTNPANYEFRLLPAGSFQASGTFLDLTVGVQNFEVRNTVTGCVLVISHEVVDPEVLNLNLVSTTDITCFGDTNGAVSLDLQDASNVTYTGATSYTLYYDVNNTPGNLADDITSTGSDADGAFTITGLAAGAYLIEVVDDNPPGFGCTYTQSFNIAGPNVGLSANIQVSEVTCLLNDGSIEIINAAGGWGGYSYYVGTVAPSAPTDYVASPLFENLSGGGAPGTTYQVWIKDQFDCELQLSDVILVDPDPITATLQINTPNCTNIEGEIEVVGTTGGQNANYTFQLRRNVTLVGSPQTNPVFTGLGAGVYVVEIADQWSCTHTTNSVELFDEIVPDITVDKPIDCTVDPGGHVTVSQTGGSGAFTYAVTFPDLSTPLPTNNTGIFTGLTLPGTYTFTITDNATGHACVKTITLNLDDRVDPIITNVVEDPVNCNGGSDGSLTVVLDPATAVNPVYTYELYEIANLGTPFRTAQTSNIFDNLPAGDYRVRVISGRSCDDFFDQTVTEPAALNVSASANTFTCSPANSVNTVTITAVATDGTAPYLYSIDNVNFQTSTTFDIVDTGAVQNITVFVRDANGCLATDAVTIDPINVFSAAVTQIPGGAIDCTGPEEILITVTDDGNPANTYTYQLLPVGNTLGTLTATPTNVTANFELTAPGSYTFRVTDTTTGCYFDTTPYVIAPFDLIDVVVTPTTPITCFGDTNGEASLNITGYTGTYDFEVFNANGTTTGITGSGDTNATNPLSVGNLPGGNFFVRVVETANPLCTQDSNIFTIASPDSPLDATPVEVANVTCTNNLGEIEVSPTGGYAPYDIVLTNTTTGQIYIATDVSSMIFGTLSEGTFDVQITDDNGCVINRPISLTQPIPITADITATPTTLVCFGDTNASVSAINVINGRGEYQYQLNIYDPTGTTIVSSSGLQSGSVFNNLGAGIYSITVSDGWSCDVETIQATISEPVEVMANLIQLTQLTCTNLAQIELSATGGTGPYEFSLDNIIYSPMTGAGGDTHVFTVPDGAYQYFVRDAFGCEAMISNQITVDPITPLDVLIDDSAAFINCTGEASATIIADAIGGLGNYSYELFSDPGLTSSVAGPQTTGEFSGLLAGTYYVHVTSVDCDVTSGVINIQDPAPLQIDRQESTDVTCAGLNDGTITVEVSGGTGEIFYAITPNLNQFDTVNVFTDLAPGIYDVIAQDRNGCFETFQFEIEQPDPILADAINVMHEVCFNSADGSFELDITGGTAPYYTSLNSNAVADFVQDQILFQNLPAGTHVVFVRDSQDCETNVIVEINPGVNLAAAVTPLYTCNGNIPDNSLNIVFEDPTVMGDVLYALDSTDPLDMQLTADFTNIPPGDHYLTIAHSNGCINTVDFTIEAFEPLTLILENSNINEITATATGGLEEYTFFFGDVDNGNDNTFIINRTDTYPVTVIDQNGCEVTMEIFLEFIDIEIPDFFTPDGDNLNDEWLPDNLEAFPNVLIIIFDRYGRELHRQGYGDRGWNGLYNNSELPTGDYWYIIKLQGENDDREFIGHFTLYRQ